MLGKGRRPWTNKFPARFASMDFSLFAKEKSLRSVRLHATSSAPEIINAQYFINLTSPGNRSGCNTEDKADETSFKYFSFLKFQAGKPEN